MRQSDPQDDPRQGDAGPPRSRSRSRWRPAARGMRRVRRVRPSGRRRHHGARPARPAASRPGSRRHRLLRRPALPFRAPDRPGRRHLLAPRGDRAPARHVGDRPCALLDHRRDHPAQRAAAVRRARCRRLRARPQRQPDQRPDAAPPIGARRRHHPVDHRYRGDPAPGRAIAPQPLRRPLHRCAARDRGRLFAGRAHQQEAGRRPRSARHPAAGDRTPRRQPIPRLGDLRARHHRRQIRARRRERRDRGVRRGGRPFPQAVPADAGAALHLRIRLFRPAGFGRGRPLGLRGAQHMGAELAQESRPPPTWWCRCRTAASRPPSALPSTPACRSRWASSATTMWAAPSSSRPSRSARSGCA